MENQEHKIRETIQTYVKGYLNAEKALVAKAFHTETRLYSVDQGRLSKTEMSDWFTNLDARKIKGDLREAQFKLVSLDVTDQSAVAKIELDFAKAKFTDYLSLLHFDGQWKIVGKIYNAAEKADLNALNRSSFLELSALKVIFSKLNENSRKISNRPVLDQ